ncbi:MAG: hypothetical protein ACR2LQ_02295 [Acidimicrobiales bacterium]
MPQHVAVTVAALELLEVHRGFAWVVIIGNALAGVWALAAHRYRSLRTRALWWFTVAMEVTIFIQVSLGVAIVNAEKIDPPQFHLLYGFAGIIAIGIIYSYKTTSPWVRERIYLVYGATGLFLMGLGIRAVLVANA